jgi:hypothetical protein
VTRAFFDVLAAETVSLTERTMQAVGEVRQSVSARVAAGAVSIEETRAEISLAAVRVESECALLLGAARGSARRHLGSSRPRFCRPSATSGRCLPFRPARTLLARLADNPYLARWAAEISQQRRRSTSNGRKAFPTWR